VKMTKREIAFFLAGLGIGLVVLLALIGFPEIFLFALFWHHGLIIALCALAIVGIFIVRSRARVPAKRDSR
jgi:hypothetical protein